MVVPAELEEVLVSWQRWALGLEGLAFGQVVKGGGKNSPVELADDEAEYRCRSIEDRRSCL